MRFALQLPKLLIVCIIASLLLVSLKSFAQSKQDKRFTDSIAGALRIEKNTIRKLIDLNALCLIIKDTNADTAFMYADSGLGVAQKTRQYKYLSVFYEHKGEIYMKWGDFKNSLQQFKLSYIIASKYHSKRIMALATNGFGVVYQMQGNFALAQDFFFRALRIAEQIKDKAIITGCTINIGVIFSSEKNFDKAIIYANKTLQFNKIYPLPLYEAKAFEILGTVNDDKALHQKARTYYYRALKIYQEHKNESGMASIYSLLVATYVDDPAMQLKFCFNAKKIYDKIAPNDIYAILNIGNIGIAYDLKARAARKNGYDNAKSRRLFKKAGSYLSDGLKLAKANNVRVAVIDIVDSIASVDAAINDYKGAYTSLQYRNKINDSIYSQDNKNKIASLEGKHEIDLRDKQLLINKLEIANQHKQRWFLLGGLLTLFIISGLIYYQNMQRKRTNTTLLQLNTELDEANKVKTRFFSILNHDLRSPVASFVNFLHLQQEAPDLMDEAARSAYSKKATASAENLLNTMEDLLLWSKGQMENFKPTNRVIPVGDLFQYVKTSLNLPENILLSFEQQPGMELNIDEHYVKTIMYNLTNNAIKALGDAAGSSIVWKAWAEVDQKYLSITDNGPGAAEEAFKALYDDAAPIGIKTGLGLHIIRDLAKAINCKISVLTKPGSGSELKLMFS